jgi:hypothetical protein
MPLIPRTQSAPREGAVMSSLFENRIGRFPTRAGEVTKKPALSISAGFF